MKVSHGDKGDGHGWNKWQVRRFPRGINFARGRTCEGREGTERPAGFPASAWKQERQRNTGRVLVCEVRHMSGSSCSVLQGVHREASQQNQSGSARMEQQEQSGSSRRRQHAEAGTLLAASWMRSLCQTKRRSLTKRWRRSATSTRGRCDLGAFRTRSARKRRRRRRRRNKRRRTIW